MNSENILEIKDLACGYQEKTILQGISFSLKRGELVGIIGANGAGKSTLLKTIAGELPPCGGDLMLFSASRKTMSEKTFAQRVAYLAQANEFPFAIRSIDYVCMGRYPYRKWWEQDSAADLEIAMAALRFTGAEPFAQRDVRTLSGGQRQRVLLARIFAQRTPILMLDEPTTGLDLIYQEELFHLIARLSTCGRTTLMVVHELSMAARFCTRLLIVAKGSILADGAPKELLKDDLLTQIFHAPLYSVENPLTGHLDIFSKEPTPAHPDDLSLLLKEEASHE